MEMKRCPHFNFIKQLITMNPRIIVLLLFLFFTTDFVLAQSNNPFSFNGNVRFAHLGSDTDALGLGGDNTTIRTRIGASYKINETSSFVGRIAFTFSEDFEQAKFTIAADGNGLNYGSISFDQFYYQYQNESISLKIGRFQESLPVHTNAGRSHLRFQSNVNFIHWSDGIYFKKNINEDWYSEVIAEYQPRNRTTYLYRGALNFKNNPNNFTGYFGVENNNRDDLNIIQKGFGFFIAPDSYLKPDGYATYVAFSSRIALDFSSKDLLHGGSFRIGGELGQNLNTTFENGTNMVASIGVNNVADKHEFMIEFARNDSQWLTATVFAPNSDEIELRYRFFFSQNLNFDIRYRIRENRTDTNPTAYSTFLRATYSF